MLLQSERLSIRSFEAEDLELIYDINNHPECIRFNGWDSMSMEQCENVLNKWMNDYEKHPHYGAFCVTTKDGQSIGMCFIMQYAESFDYEIGFRLKRTEWGKGYATEIARCLMEYGETVLEAHEICAEVHTENENSLNVFRKLGFKEFIHPEGEEGKLFKYPLTNHS